MSASDMEQWSLRNVCKSMTSKARVIGVQVGNLIERELNAAPHVEDAIINNFGKPAGEVVCPTRRLDDVRAKFADLLQRNKLDEMPHTCDVGPIDNGAYQTVIRGHLLEYWAKVVGDPAAFAARWLYEGAPAGLSLDINLTGICTEVDDDAPELDEVALATNYESFTNYEGVEDNEDAVSAIRGYFEKGYLHVTAFRKPQNSWEQSRCCPSWGA